MSRSQGLEQFLGCLNGWTCESALPLGPERAQTPSLHCHSASIVPIVLPLGLERDA